MAVRTRAVARSRRDSLCSEGSPELAGSTAPTHGGFFQQAFTARQVAVALINNFTESDFFGATGSRVG